jgi:hypothetical protein
MADQSEPKKERRVKIGEIVLVVILLLGPGIRGYDNWELHQYAFIAAIIGSIVYAWITGNRFWKDGEKKTNSEGEEA